MITGAMTSVARSPLKRSHSAVPEPGQNIVPFVRRPKSEKDLDRFIERELAAGVPVHVIGTKLGVPPMMIAKARIRRHYGQN